MKVVLYARVSTKDQNVAMQVDALTAYAKSRQLEIVGTYCDEGISGTIAERPELKKLMGEARKRKFDAVLVYRFDRFARSTQHLITAMLEFKRLKIDFISYQENIDTSSPLGEAIFTIVAAIGQLERDIIRQRVLSGLESAKSRGTKLGRKRKRNDQEILSLYAKGMGVRQIGKELGLSNSSVQAALASVPESLSLSVRKG